MSSIKLEVYLVAQVPAQLRRLLPQAGRDAGGAPARRAHAARRPLAHPRPRQAAARVRRAPALRLARARVRARPRLRRARAGTKTPGLYL